MKDIDLKIPKGNYSIYSNNIYIIAIGKGIFVYDMLGGLLWSRLDFKYIHKIAFLSEESIVADCCSLGLYIVLSLNEGKILKQIKIPKSDYTGLKFALSSDQRYLYDTYFFSKQQINCGVLKIDLLENEIEYVPLDIGLRATHDIICDENDRLCILQTQHEMIGDKEFCLFGVRYESFDTVFGRGSSYYWKEKCYFEFPRSVCHFVDNVNLLLTNDFNIYNLQDKTMNYLLENDTYFLEENSSCQYCQLNNSKRYLQLKYHNREIIVDLQENKIVARYFTESNGCIIGNEYWVCSNDGIVRKPFPLIESDDMKPKEILFLKGQGDGSIVSSGS